MSASSSSGGYGSGYGAADRANAPSSTCAFLGSYNSESAKNYRTEFSFSSVILPYLPAYVVLLSIEDESSSSLG